MKEYLKDKEIAQRFGVTTQTIWNWSRRGDFPRPIRLGGNTTRWLASEVNQWEDERAYPGTADAER